MYKGKTIRQAYKLIPGIRITAVALSLEQYKASLKTSALDPAGVLG